MFLSYNIGVRLCVTRSLFLTHTEPSSFHLSLSRRILRLPSPVLRKRGPILRLASLSYAISLRKDGEDEVKLLNSNSLAITITTTTIIGR